MISVNPMQESQIMRVASAASDFNLDKVVDRLDNGLLYVDQGLHTPIVVIKRAFNGINGLFGWENYPDMRHRICYHVLFQVQYFVENSDGKLDILRRLPKVHDK